MLRSSIRRFVPWVGGVVLSAAFAAPARAMTVYEDKDHDRSFDIGFLIQPQFSISKTEKLSAPDGDPSYDFFLRRARLIASGNFTKEISAYVDIDEPNWGKGGNWASDPPLIQDAILTWAPERWITLDAGYQLVPFTHQGLEGAASLHMLDYRTDFLRYPQYSGNVLRDVGVAVRGLFLDDLIYYRIGVFEGVRQSAVPASTSGLGSASAPKLNEQGLPRVAGTVRVNLAGAEDKLFLGGIYFADKTMLSIGVSGDYQRHAVYVPSATGAGAVDDYWAVAGDVFFEHPLSPDDEVLAKAAFTHVSQGAGAVSTGNGGYAEAGFRHGLLEPVAAFEYWQADANVQSRMAIEGGVNFWFKKHNANVKLDFLWRRTQTPATNPTTTLDESLGTLQGQVFF